MRIGVVCVIKEGWGGSEELWAAMAHEAITQGHEMVVTTYNCGDTHPKMQALIDRGLKLVYRRGYVKPGIPVWRRILEKAKILALNKLVNPFSNFFTACPDVILYNGTSYTCLEDKQLFAGILKRGIPYFYLSHIAADFYRPVKLGDIGFISTAFNNAKYSFFVAERTISITQRQICSNIKGTEVIRNPVNMEDLSIIDFPNVEHTINFATVGLLVAAHKGQDMLFEVLSGKNWKLRNWHLNIYGSGVDEYYLKELTKLYGIEDKVTFHGKIANIRSIWQKNHLLIMPSLMEGMPLAVVEAMICGRPCLVTDVGDHRIWIEEESSGFIAEAPSPYSINKALEKAWDCKNEWKLMGTNAHKKAISMIDKNPGGTLLSIMKKHLV